MTLRFDCINSCALAAILTFSKQTHLCLVDANSASGSLASLNLAENQLGPKGAKHIAEVLPKW